MLNRVIDAFNLLQDTVCHFTKMKDLAVCRVCLEAGKEY